MKKTGIPTIYGCAREVLVGRVGEFDIDIKFGSCDLDEGHILDGMYHKAAGRCYYDSAFSNCQDFR